MKKYWVFAPQNSTRQELFNKSWVYDLKIGTIAVGWFEFGNPFQTKLSEEEYKKKYIEIYRKDNPHERLQFWYFYNDISIGDTIKRQEENISHRRSNGRCIL